MLMNCNKIGAKMEQNEISTFYSYLNQWTEYRNILKKIKNCFK